MARLRLTGNSLLSTTVSSPTEGKHVVAAKRIRMTAQQRREQLVGVGCALFAEKGYSAASIEEIAERAEVSKPVVYQHFGGKEGLYAVVVDREVRHLTASIRRAFDAGHPRLIAEGAADAFLSYIEEHEEGFRVLVRDAPIGMTGGSFASVIADVASRAEELLVDEFPDRGFNEDTAPMYALMLVGAVALIGEWWLDHRTMPRDAVAAHVVNLLWNGLRALEPVAGGDGNRHRRPSASRDAASRQQLSAVPDLDLHPVTDTESETLAESADPPRMDPSIDPPTGLDQAKS
ncbi:MAG: TetR/AcrR family transcriptional regulator [Nitriliruptoraceae bacterium]